MTIRITGMNSGLDTESIIKELASARSVKVQNIEKDQTKLSWKIDAWKELNSKIYSLYTDVLSDMRFDYAYSKKTTKVSNPNAVSVVTGNDAVNGAQSMKISQLAKASYLTGGAVSSKAASFTGSAMAKDGVAAYVTGGKMVESTILNGNRISGATDGTKTMKELGILKEGESSKFTLTTSGTSYAITVSDGMTLNDVLSELQGKGVTATFADGHFTLTEATKGADSFSIAKVKDDTLSASLISKLGLDAKLTTTELAKGNQTTLAELGFSGSPSITVKIGDASTTIDLTGSNTLSEVARKFRNAGLNARFNQAEGRFMISAKDSAKDLEILDNNKSGILERLGIASEATREITGQTTLAALGFGKDGEEITFNLTFDNAAEATPPITLKGYQTLDDVAAELEDRGLNAQFNPNTGQFVLSTKEVGRNFDISAVTNDTVSASLVERLGLKYDEGKGPSAGKVEDGTTKLKDLGFGTDGKEVKFKLTIGTGADAKVEEVTLKGNQTLDDVAAMFKEKGLNAKFDAATKRFFISAKESGAANGFTIEAKTKGAYDSTTKTYAWEDNEESLTALKNLGLYYDPNNLMNTDKVSGQATMVQAQDAEVEINGAQFTFTKNTFEVNGLTITAMQTTKEGEEITLTTQQDTDGIYDMIKNFVKKYSELINEMDKLYNAKSASKYQPLTKEEKDAMSDTEVEEWEKTIKESLLRRDTTLSSVASAMKNVMMSTHLDGKIGINDGKDIYLTFFGIETLGYYKSKDNEKNAYHINGDTDDTNVKNNEDKLKKAIANDPDTVIEFFKSLANNLYTTLDEKMARVQGYSSAFTVYNDLQMNDELKKYASKIETEQKKLNDYVDRWYKKFSQMEVAMAKLKSKESSLSGLFGG